MDRALPLPPVRAPVTAPALTRPTSDKRTPNRPLPAPPAPQGGNLAPGNATAAPDNYTVACNGTLMVPAASGVLANDAAVPAGGNLVASLMLAPTDGTLVNLASDGSFTYVSRPGSPGEWKGCAACAQDAAGWGPWICIHAGLAAC